MEIKFLNLPFVVLMVYESRPPNYSFDLLIPILIICHIVWFFVWSNWPMYNVSSSFEKLDIFRFYPLLFKVFKEQLVPIIHGQVQIIDVALHKRYCTFILALKALLLLLICPRILLSKDGLHRPRESFVKHRCSFDKFISWTYEVPLGYVITVIRLR